MTTESSGKTRTPRRGFLAQAAALALGAAAYGAPVLAALWPFTRTPEKKSAGGFRRLASLDALVPGGPPYRAAVVDARTDAWTRFPPEPVGAVFLQRAADGRVTALNVRCPHAGCFVDFDAADKRFFCPCHKAAFALDGHRLDAVLQSPRDLDELAVEIRNKSEVWVRFQQFRTGTAEKNAE
jgi:menaquinol-cytochrome c reductase iron-sulfur subunit